MLPLLSLAPGQMSCAYVTRASSVSRGLLPAGPFKRPVPDPNMLLCLLLQDLFAFLLLSFYTKRPCQS